MRRFLRRALCFSAPFLLYALAIYLVDPFGVLNGPAVIATAIKFPIAMQLNPCIWKMNQFRRHPLSGILLGDSRMAELDGPQVSEVAGKEYFNFAYGGGSLKEAIDTFWFAQSHVALHDVYIGVNLNVYNDYDYTERTQEFLGIASNPAIYFVNRNVLQAAAYDVYSSMSHTDLKLGVPTLSRDDFWRDQLGPLTAAYYSKYLYPERYNQDLAAIARFCASHSIHLAFIIFPTHVELQNRISDFHLQHEASSMRTDLASLGTVYDFDYANDLTSDKANYRDPYHFNATVAAMLIREIWGGAATHYGHVLAPSR